MIKRHIQDVLRDVLADTPVVLLTGARQSGKSTLVEHLAETDHPAGYITFDDADDYSSGRSEKGRPSGGLNY